MLDAAFTRTFAASLALRAASTSNASPVSTRTAALPVAALVAPKDQVDIERIKLGAAADATGLVCGDEGRTGA
jgi:hypothetical protein